MHSRIKHCILVCISCMGAFVQYLVSLMNHLPAMIWVILGKKNFELVTFPISRSFCDLWDDVDGLFHRVQFNAVRKKLVSRIYAYFPIVFWYFTSTRLNLPHICWDPTLGRLPVH